MMKGAVMGLGGLGLGLGLLMVLAASGEDEGVPEIRSAPGDPPLPPAPRTSSGAPVVPGVTFNSGVVLTPQQRNVLLKVRAGVPSSIPIHVTSGLRTAEKQAAALVIKRNRGENLYALYTQDDLVAEIMRVPNTTEAMAAVFRSQVARGRYLSPHMTGRGIDFRTYKWSAQQLATFVAAAQRLGLSTLKESDHLHMQWKTGAAPTLAGAGGCFPSPRHRPGASPPKRLNPGGPARRPYHPHRRSS